MPKTLTKVTISSAFIALMVSYRNNQRLSGTDTRFAPERAPEEDVRGNILKHWLVHYQHQKPYQHSSYAAIDST
jgi:hypothetical protein